MLIREFVDAKSGLDLVRLAAITKLIINRAKDQSAQKQMSQDAYIEAARSIGVNVTPDTLGDVISQEPLSNLLEPLDPNSGVVRFKGNTEADTGMSVDQAQEVVNSNAKAALRRRQ